jgi:YVTN family beta-propeller protein
VFLNEERAPVVIDTGDYSEGLAVSPDGREVWVGNRYGGTIEIVDTGTLKIVDTITTGTYPTRMDFTGDGRVATVSGLTAREGTGAFTVYDQKTRKVVFTHKLRDFPAAKGSGPGGILGVAVGGGHAYVDDQNAGRVTVFNLANLNETPRVLTDGHDFPDGIAWSATRLNVFGGK